MDSLPVAVVALAVGHASELGARPQGGIRAQGYAVSKEVPHLGLGLALDIEPAVEALVAGMDYAHKRSERGQVQQNPRLLIKCAGVKFAD